MNFLFLNSARRWGGNEKWTYMASHALSQNNNVYFAYRREAVGERFAIDKIKLPFLNEFDLYTLIKLIGIVFSRKINIIISTKPKDYVLGGIVARIFNIKNFIRLGIVRFLGDSWIKNLVYNKLNDGIIVNAPQIKEELLKSPFMKPEKIKVIYNGINTDEIDDQFKDGDFEKPFNFTICSMGELSQRKGFDDLIKGFAYFIHEFQIADAGLVIIGGGEELNHLRNLASSLKIAGKILFAGFLENPYPHLNACDVFVSASRNEGISNALLEAMYLKKAVIATAVGGANRVIEENKNGCLVKNGNVAEEIGKYLFQLYKDENLRRCYASEGYNTVMNDYSMARMADEIEAFCKV